MYKPRFCLVFTILFFAVRHGGSINMAESRTERETMTETTAHGGILFAANTASVYMPDAPTSGGDQSECAQDPLQTLTATATVGPGETLVWYDAATGGNVVASPTLNSIGTATYYAEAVDAGNVPSSSRTAVALTILPPQQAPVSTGDVAYCTGDPLPPLTVTAQPGNVVNWYDAPVGGNQLASNSLSFTPSVAGTYYAEVAGNMGNTGGGGSGTTTFAGVDLIDGGLANQVRTFGSFVAIGGTVNSVLVDNDINTYAFATPSTTQAIAQIRFGSPALNHSGFDIALFELDANLGVFELTINGVTLPITSVFTGEFTNDVDRFPINVAQVELSDFGVLLGDTVPGIVVNFLTSNQPSLSLVGLMAESGTSQPLCPSVPRTPVTLIERTLPAAPVGGGDIVECAASPVQTLTATATAGPGETVVWYDSATGGNVVANPVLSTVDDITYHAEAVNLSTGCTSAARTPVALTIESLPAAPVGGGDIVECAASPVQTLTATATAGPGETVVWYDSATGGNVVASPTLNNIGTAIYYAESRFGATGCISASRTAVSLTLRSSAIAPVSNGDMAYCPSASVPALSVTPQSGSTVNWFGVAFGGTSLVQNSTSYTPSGPGIFYAEAVDLVTGCPSTTRTAVELSVLDCQVSLLKDGTFIDMDGDMFADTDDLVRYTFTITNTGGISVGNILLDDKFLDPDLMFAQLPPANLDPGQEWSTTADYGLKSDDIARGVVYNRADVSALTANGDALSAGSQDPTPIDGSNEFFLDSCPSCTVVLLPIENPGISLIKTAVFDDNNGDGASSVGETITYSFRVANEGNVELFDITIEDELPGLELSGDPISLKPGEYDDTSFKAIYRITEEDIARGRVENTALARGISAARAVVEDISDDNDAFGDESTVTDISKLCELRVFNGISRFKDGRNDIFWIENIDCYPDNKVSIYNRWGVKVFETIGYDNQSNFFDGTGTGRLTVGRTAGLSSATYFYILEYENNGSRDVLTGYLYIN